MQPIPPCPTLAPPTPHGRGCNPHCVLCCTGMVAPYQMSCPLHLAGAHLPSSNPPHACTWTACTTHLQLKLVDNSRQIAAPCHPQLVRAPSAQRRSPMVPRRGERRGRVEAAAGELEEGRCSGEEGTQGCHWHCTCTHWRAEHYTTARAAHAACSRATCAEHAFRQLDERARAERGS